MVIEQIKYFTVHDYAWVSWENLVYKHKSGLLMNKKDNWTIQAAKVSLIFIYTDLKPLETSKLVK